MAVAKTLGFDLCPRLSSIRDRQLHVPRGFAIPEELAPMPRKARSVKPRPKDFGVCRVHGAPLEHEA